MRRRVPAAVFLAALATLLLSAAPASAHGFTSTVYADLTSGEAGHVRASLGLEYDLLVVSVADAEMNDTLFRRGTAAFENLDTKAQAAALHENAASVLSYVANRFTIGASGQACTPALDGPISMEEREGVPYARLVLDYRCPQAMSHEIRSDLFPDAEGYVRDTKTITTYDLDLTSGSAALDARQPVFSTEQGFLQRFWEFFRLGAEHLLTGTDHLLFLIALIAGSRRLREIVLAATTFTVAHSVTFVIAALGLVHPPASVVEPVIALSIAVVAAWPLWQWWRHGSHADDLVTAGHRRLAIDRAGMLRLAAVFAFGLVHGLGFASALGIDAAWSWTLLWSLLVFNLGIEIVQLAIIAIVFPLLVLVRRKGNRVSRRVTATIAAGVSGTGLVWFVERLLET